MGTILLTRRIPWVILAILVYTIVVNQQILSMIFNVWNEPQRIMDEENIDVPTIHSSVKHIVPTVVESQPSHDVDNGDDTTTTTIYHKQKQHQKDNRHHLKMSYLDNMTTTSFHYSRDIPHYPPSSTITSSSFHKVKIKQDETFLWKGRQKKFCKHLSKEMSKQLHHHNNQRMVALVGVPCQSLHDQHRHGNFILGLYAMHIGALAYHADLWMLCKERQQYDNIFWWLQSFPASIPRKRQLLLHQHDSNIHDDDDADDGGGKKNHTITLPNPTQACAGMGKLPFEYAYPLAKNDFRNMAMALLVGPSTKEIKHNKDVGMNSKLNTALSEYHRLNHFPTRPLYPTLELDSIAIHVRCGDVLSRLDPKSNGNYGLLPFIVYRNVIQQYVTFHNNNNSNNNNNNNSNNPSVSIGIITAPFGDPQTLRKQDAQHALHCQELMIGLQDYLRYNFPTSRVTIRNDPSDTIPIVYSRLVMANQLSMCIRSTFCLFATLASFANHKVLMEGGVSYFVSSIQDNSDEENTIVLLPKKTTPYLLSHEIHHLGWNRTLEWLYQEHDIKEWKKRKN